MTWLTALTDFGDLAVLLPLVAMTLLWLFLMRARRGAAWWAMAVSVCVGLTALAKVFAYACPPAPDLHSPSGHTSLSTLVYGAMALITASESGSWKRVMSITIGAAFILGIAASRVLLAIHSTREVGVGLVVGAIALTLFGQGYLRCRPIPAYLGLYLSAASVVMLIFHGQELHAEEFLHAVTGYLHVHYT